MRMRGLYTEDIARSLYGTLHSGSVYAVSWDNRTRSEAV
jgi:hypothetical protein